MSGYPRGEALLARCRAGQGKIVIVEGESDDQDPFFYKTWFGDVGLSVSFIPQNGCDQVVKAVAELRDQLGPSREVYGIRDRDFYGAADLVSEIFSVPTDGVFRPRRYTLENYMLEPVGWYEVIKLVHRSKRPSEWDSVDAVHERVLDAYRRCLPVAAFNFTVNREYARLPIDTTNTRFGYKPHPDAVTPTALDQLDRWGAERGMPRLRDAYEAELAKLRTDTFEEWQQRVTGKAVLKLFQSGFPGCQPPLLDNLYLRVFPHSPEELAHIIDRILAAP